MATFRKLPSGNWRAEVHKRGVRDSAVRDTKTEARAWADAREDEIERSATGKIARTFRQTLNRYLEDEVPGHKGKRWEEVRIAKFKGEGRDEGAALPFLDKTLDALTTDDLTTWKADGKRAGLSDSSIRREYAIVRRVLRLARIEWKWTKNNPLEGFKPPKKPKDRRRAISQDEIERVVLALNYSRGERPRTARQFVACAFLLAIETAMRQGEILALTPFRVYREEHYLRTMPTKNGDERDVPLSLEALAILAVLPHQGPLFPVKPGTFDTTFRAAVKRAEIANLHFHDSRHEGITRLAKKLPVLDLARAVGHNDLNSLLIYYESDATGMAAKLRQAA
jgi:integrase